MSKTWGFFLVAQDMVLSHRAKFQLIINFFRVLMYFVVFLPDYIYINSIPSLISTIKSWINSIDSRLLFLVSTARTTTINRSVESQRIANTPDYSTICFFPENIK